MCLSSVRYAAGPPAGRAPRPFPPARAPIPLPRGTPGAEAPGPPAGPALGSPQSWPASPPPRRNWPEPGPSPPAGTAGTRAKGSRAQTRRPAARAGTRPGFPGDPGSSAGAAAPRRAGRPTAPAPAPSRLTLSSASAPTAPPAPACPPFAIPFTGTISGFIPPARSAATTTAGKSRSSTTGSNCPPPPGQPEGHGSGLWPFGADAVPGSGNPARASRTVTHGLNAGPPSRACPSDAGSACVGPGHRNRPSTSRRRPIKNTRRRICGTPKSAAFSTRASTAYPTPRKSPIIWRYAAPPAIESSPGTFSITNHAGRRSRSTRTNSRYRKFRGSSIKRFPAIENPWHGGPPTSTSPSGISADAILRISPVRAAPDPRGKFRRHAFTAQGELSFANAARKPARSNPRSIPPAPLNSEIRRGASNPPPAPQPASPLDNPVHPLLRAALHRQALLRQIAMPVPEDKPRRRRDGLLRLPRELLQNDSDH